MEELAKVLRDSGLEADAAAVEADIASIRAMSGKKIVDRPRTHRGRPA
jgi:hypothetical protein